MQFITRMKLFTVAHHNNCLVSHLVMFFFSDIKYEHTNSPLLSSFISPSSSSYSQLFSAIAFKTSENCERCVDCYASNAINFHILENFCLPFRRQHFAEQFLNADYRVFGVSNTRERQAAKINKFVIATHDYVIWAKDKFIVRLADRPLPISLLSRISTDARSISTIVGWFSNFLYNLLSHNRVHNNMLARSISPVAAYLLITIKSKLQTNVSGVHVRFHWNDMSSHVRAVENPKLFTCSESWGGGWDASKW